MKKKIVYILLILNAIMITLIVFTDINSREIDYTKFSFKQLTEYCNDIKLNCKISEEYSDDIKEGEHIKIDTNNHIYIFSKGPKQKEVIENFEINFGAAGDMITYSPGAYTHYAANGSWDFSGMFTSLSDKINNYDISSYVQESIAAGCFESYPLFCSPFEISNTMVNYLGFDVVSMANNHVLDQGHDAIDKAISHYETLPIEVIGTFKQNSTTQLPKIIEKNGIKVGTMAYTTTLNGFTPKNGLEYTISTYSEERVILDTEYLRDQEVDFIITYIHWGDEYSNVPNQTQIDIANYMANAGVDVILGTHTHSIQPIDEIIRNDGNKTLVIYSIGNFNAAQHSFKYETAYSGIFEFKLNKQVVDGKVKSLYYSDVAFYPIYHSSWETGLISSAVSDSIESNNLNYVCDLVTIESFHVRCYN